MIKTIALDDQNFDVIVDHARKAIRKYAPNWTDENAHDPGITLIELFAWLKEMLQFYMDQPTEAIEMQFLKLLGMSQEEGEEARMVVQTVDLIETCKLPKGSKLTKGRFCFETMADITLEPAKIVDVCVDHEGELKSVYQLISNGLTFYPFGADAKVGTSFYIQMDKALTGKKVLLFYIKVLDQYEVKRNPIEDPKTFSPFGEITWYGSRDQVNWVPLHIVRDETFGMIQSGLIGIDVSNDDTWVRGTLTASDYDMPPRIIDIYNRVFEVCQKETAESPGSAFNSTGLPFQRFELPFEDIVYKTLEIEVLEVKDESRGSWKSWKRVEEISEASEAMPCFSIDQHTQSICFGDGIHGKIPPKGEGVIRIAHMERSYFDQGNIHLDHLVHEATGNAFKCLTPATGGRKRSSLATLKTELRAELAKPRVCVTALDYEQIIKETPGLMIKKTKCLPLYKPGLTDYPNQTAMNTVSVFVIPYGSKEQMPLSHAYRRNLENYMEKHRLITTEVLLLDPVYFNIEITCEIGTPFEESKAFEDARNAILQANHYDFGEPISKSQIYKLLSHCESVSRINGISLRCNQSVVKNRLGDIEIPANGIGNISKIEIVFIHD